MKGFVTGVVVGVVALLAAGYLFLTQGGMPVAARDAKPLPLERFLTSRALHVAMLKDANRAPPFPADPQNLLAGAKVYRRTCELCHGPPGETRRSPVALGMFPRPPPLLPPRKGVTDDPVGETYWKVKNGIRLTGMPSFEGSLTDAELWQVSLFLAHANELPPEVADALR